MDTKGDYHVHTTLSDGGLTPKEAIESAISFGLNEIGISDHYFTKKDKIPCIDDREIDGYIRSLQVLKKKYSKEIRVYIGLEIDTSDYNPKRATLPFKKLNKLDFVLFEYVENVTKGKEIQNLLRKENSGMLDDCYREKGVFTLKDLIEIRKKFSCKVGLVHPNFSKDFVKYSPKQLAKILKENSIFIDVYVKPDEHQRSKYWPISSFVSGMGKYAKEIKSQKVDIFPGTDTHKKNKIGSVIEAEKVLKKLGYRNQS